METTGKGVETTGKAVKVTGKTMQATGKGMQVAGKGMKIAGEGASTAGKAMTEAGAALSGTGIGALAGIPLAALGAGTTAAGAGMQAAGTGAETAGKGVETAGKGVEATGEGIEKTGQGIRNTGTQMKNIGNNMQNIANSSQDKNNETIPAMPTGTSVINNDGSNFKKILKVVKLFLIKVVIILMILLLIAGFAWAIVKSVAELISNLIDSLGNSYVAIDITGNLEEGINITDEQINNIVKSLEERGTTVEQLYLCGDIDYEKDADDPENIKQRNKYLRQFLLAELCTQYPDFGIQEDETHYNGIIKIKRESANSDGTSSTDMTYVRKDVFDNIITAINIGSKEGLDLGKYQSNSITELQNMIMDLYSIDNNGYLYYTTWQQVVSNGETEFSVITKSVNYKKAVEKYSMPVEVPLALCIASQNPEYVYQFIEQHVLTGEIVITIQETQRVDSYTSWYDWEFHIVTKHVRPAYTDPETLEYHEEKITYTEEDEQHLKEKYNTITITNTDATPLITSVDTWMAKESISYTNTRGKVEYPLGQETVLHENVEFPDEFPSNTDTKTYSLNYCNFTEIQNIKYNEWQKGAVFSDSDAVERKAQSIVSQWDELYRIPNTYREERAGENIKIDSGILLELLDANESTQKQAEIFRYLLYLYTNEDYGVKGLESDLFTIEEFTTVGTIYGNNLEEKVWFALIDAGYSEIATAGAMGNISWESGGFQASATERGGTGIGLCQWSFGRGTQLKAYAESKGVDWTDEDTQIEFLIGELTPGGGANGYATYQLKTYNGYSPQQWYNATTPEDASDAFCWSFERPNKSKAHTAERSSRARKYYETFAGKTRSNFESSATAVANSSSAQKLAYLFPNGVPTNKSECEQYLTMIDVPMTQKDGTKFTGKLTVHRALAQDVKDVFQTAQDAGFKIYSAYAYSYRMMNNGSSSSLSHHSYGVAIDINVTENYSHRGSIIYAGSFWNPSLSEFSIPRNGALVQAFASKGWRWGGNWSGDYQDYMHFSFTGN